MVAVCAFPVTPAESRHGLLAIRPLALCNRDPYQIASVLITKGDWRLSDTVLTATGRILLKKKGEIFSLFA
jgi:hypothetical protein